MIRVILYCLLLFPFCISQSYTEDIVLNKKVYGIGYLTELKFTCSVTDSSETYIKDLSIHVVLYTEGKNNIAYLIGIESGTWRGIDQYSRQSQDFILKFDEPYYDLNKVLK